MAEVKMPEMENEKAPEKLEKVVKGEVKKRKASSGLAGEFVKEEPSYVRDYILGEVVLPAVKNLISDMVKNSVDLFLFGQTTGRTSSPNRDRTRYSSYGSRRYDDDFDDRPRRRNRASRYDDFSDIVMSSRADAITVLNDLKDQIEDYGCATVANFYELVGEDSGHTDTKYGWENLDRAYVDSVRGGYIIEFPRAKYLD